MGNLMDGSTLELGVCYYPEHWPENGWAEDLDRMLAAGLHTVRVAEFAWSRTEPEEGVFTFDFWQRFLDLCAEKGMKVIFCTPTATPPAWLTERYPEVLNRSRDGQTYYHGLRQHCSRTSPVMRHFSRRITEALASHYAQHPAVVGWQLDNEINCETCEYHSQSDDAAFRAWLIRRYGSLEKLNDAWGTEFWNQGYTAWDQVHLPRKTVNGTGNPHQHLDSIRFVASLVDDYAREQADIIRKYIKPGDFITTNGIFGHVDYKRMMEGCYDVLTYDSYPNFSYCLDAWKPEDDGLRDRGWSRALTEVRSLSKHFGIMEQQSGANGWTTRMEAPTPRPGQLTLWTLQSVAHGADYVSFFRWRTCTFGTEIYWHGILDYSGRDNRRLREVSALHERIGKMQEIAGSAYAADVAVVRSLDNIFHAETDKWHQRMENSSREAIFRALQRSHTPYDEVWLRDEVPEDAMAEELCRYRALFVPHLQILTERAVRVLTACAERGAKLVFGARTGLMDENGHCTMARLPGLAAALTAVDIPEYSFVPPDEAPSMMLFDGKELPTPVFNELLVPRDGAEAVGTYSRGYVAGNAALVRHPVGKGEVWYLGSAFSEETVRALAQRLGVCSPFEGVVSLPEDCELAVREKDGKRFFFLLNYQKEERSAQVRVRMKKTDSGETVEGQVTLPGYGVLVLTAE